MNQPHRPPRARLCGLARALPLALAALAVDLACSEPSAGDRDAPIVGDEGDRRAADDGARTLRSGAEGPAAAAAIGEFTDAPPLADETPAEPLDLEAPLRLRVGESERAGAPVLVFSPARLEGEAREGTLIVVGTALEVDDGRLVGVIPASMIEVDGEIELAPTHRPGELEALTLAGSWERVGLGLVALARVDAEARDLELRGYTHALWIVRDEVRRLQGPVIVGAGVLHWDPGRSRIFFDAPRFPADPGGGGGGGGGGRPGGPGGLVTVVGGPPDPGPGAGTPAFGGGPGWSEPTPPGSGPLVGVIWAPPPPEPTPWLGGDDPGGWIPGGGLVGVAPLPADPPPPVDPGNLSCVASDDCPDGQACFIQFDPQGAVIQACSDGCESDDFDSRWCVDAGGCCNDLYVCSAAGTCVRPGEPADGDSGGGGGGGGGGCNSSPEPEPEPEPDPGTPSSCAGCDVGGCNGGGCDVGGCSGGGCSGGGCDLGGGGCSGGGCDLGGGGCDLGGGGCGGGGGGCDLGGGGCGGGGGGFGCRINRLNPAAGLFWMVVLMAIRPRPRRRLLG